MLKIEEMLECKNWVRWIRIESLRQPREVLATGKPELDTGLGHHLNSKAMIDSEFSSSFSLHQCSG